MADDEYSKKLESLQKYIPFLNYMITQLRDPSKKNRDQQLSKMESLHAMITDKRKRLKLETLSKCEDVIIKLYEKVNHKAAPTISSPPRPSSPPQTPASPSPPREIHLEKPVVIPTEKIISVPEKKSSTLSVFQRLGYPDRHHIPKVDIYSCAATNFNTKQSEKGSVFSRLGTKIPDMSKPPISIEDLKTLEEDEQDKFKNTTLQELNSLKEQLEKQISLEENIEKSTEPPINTTIRNNTIPVKKTVQPVVVEKSKLTDNSETTSSQLKTAKSMPNKNLLVKTKPAKVIKESDSIFGSVLSSIDDKILESKKKDKKDERRISTTDDERIVEKKKDNKDDKKTHDPRKDEKKSQDKRSDGKKSLEVSKSEKSNKDKKDSSISKQVDSKNNKSSENQLDVKQDIVNKIKNDKTENSNNENSSKKSNTGDGHSTFKRLADKYNPKPRKTSTDNMEVSNTQLDNINTSQPKPLLQDNAPLLKSPIHDVNNASNKSNETLSNNIGIKNDNFKGMEVLKYPQMQNNIVFNRTPQHVTNFDNFDNQATKYIPPLMNAPFSNLRQIRTEPVFNPPNQFHLRPQIVPQNNHLRPEIVPQNNQCGSGIQLQQDRPYPLFNDVPRFDAPVQNHNNFNQNMNQYEPYGNTPEFYNNSIGAPMQQPLVSPPTDHLKYYDDQRCHDIGHINQRSNECFVPQENRNNWNRNDPRLKRDPRNYREYREMKEKEANDTSQWNNAQNFRNVNEINKDPRCNRDPRTRERNSRESERDPRNRDNWNRSRSRDRRFDSRHSGARSRSRSRPRVLATNDAFMSPLDKLYKGNDNQVGKGYGIQGFRIPKLKKDEVDTPRQLSDDSDLIVIEEDSDQINDTCQEEIHKTPQEEVENTPEVEQQSTVKEDDCKENKNVEVADNDKKIEQAENDITVSSKETEEKLEENKLDNSPVSKKGAEQTECIKSEPSPSEIKQDGNEETSFNEKNIIIKFFANLLGRENKDQKKGALLSLISTFSDSIGEKQIQRITDIIEHGEKSSEDEEEEDVKEENIVKDTEKEQEKNASKQIDVDVSTKKKLIKKTDTKQDIKEKVNTKKSIKKPVNKPKQINTKSSTGKVKKKDTEEEEIVESIGERIKNRKKKKANPPQRKHRSELDMLHEDIQEMFIRDGVLTATGKRMCRMLKNDPNALSSSPESSKRTKLSPRLKSKVLNDIQMKNMSNVRVILSKMPDELVKDDQRRLLRSATKKISINESTEDLTTEQESNVDEDDNDTEKEVNDKEKSPEKKNLKRKRKSSWATGTIKKGKKKKLSEDFSDTENETEVNNDKTYIEPDKNYYSMSTKASCKLCSFSGRFLSNHYRMEHSEYEVLNARLSPEVAEKAIKDSQINLGKYEKQFECRTKVSEFSCRACGFVTRREPSIFYDHISIHTGEFRYSCKKCNFVTGNKKSLTKHCGLKPGHEGNTITFQKSLKNIIFSYLCGDCNYFQLNEKNVQEHIKIYHLGDTKIFKINMSTTPVEVITKTIKKRKIDNKEEQSKTVAKKKFDSDKIIEKLINDKLNEDLAMNNATNGGIKVSNEEFSSESVGPAIGLKKRAAKEKAEEKMKLQSQLENNQKEVLEDKFSDTNVEQKIEKELMPNIDKITDIVDDEVKNNVQEKIAESKEIEKNVFTCETDLLEENKKIEKERLQMMEELNKAVGNRSSLNFVDKLSSRLLKEKNVDEVVVKVEPFEDDETKEQTKNDNENMDKLETVPKIEMSTILETHLKKPLLDTNFSSSKKIDVSHKNNQFISELLQKLKGALKSNPTTTETTVLSEPPPLFDLAEIKNKTPNNDLITFDAGSIKVIKNSEKITFSCLVPPCAYSSSDKDLFQHHCREMHKDLFGTTCKVCSENITITPVLENLFIHIVTNHSDFSPSNTAIRTRKLSGDILSLKEDLFNELPDLSDSDMSLICDNNQAEKPSTSETSTPQKDAEDVSMVDLNMDEDNPFPFKIAGVMSLAEPKPPPLTPIQLKLLTVSVPSETKLTSAELNKVRKTQSALQKLLERVNELYKCPYYNCPYSTEYSDMFDIHMKSHKDDPNVMIPCVYCDIKTTVRDVRKHIEIRHAHCRYACAYCLYRAYLTEYVVCHQNNQHPLRDVSVITINISTSDVNMANMIDKKLPPQTVCTKMTCAEPCGREFLFINDFKHHLENEHSNAKLNCGYEKCTYSYAASAMASHWAVFHSVCSLQCAYCRFSTTDVNFMQRHFAVHHQSVGPSIYIRQGPIGSGYTPEAFKLMPHVSNFKHIQPSRSILKSPTITPKIIKVQSLCTTSGSNLPQTCTVKTINVSSNTTNVEPVPPLLTIAGTKTANDDKTGADLTSSADEPLIEIDTTPHTSMNEPDPLNIDSDMDTSQEIDISVPEEDLKKHNLKLGLKEFDLYKCVCGATFINSQYFKKHIINSPACKRSDPKPYECVHCGRMTRNPQSLVEHFQYHGVLRFSCSLCSTRSPSLIQIRGHMKCRHNITKVTFTPLNPDKKNLETDEFVVRPKLMVTESPIKETPIIELKTSVVNLQLSYTPEQIEKIPMRSIFSNPVKCGICQYSTKVRTNLVRHLQFHSQEINVPDTAPVNPVPCLDKNEKMFDKMTNLAISSFTATGRMGSKIDKVVEKKEENENLPEFVPIHCRYVCCAQDCNYLCPEEANLRHHLIALHDGETNFRCAHCKRVLSPTDADSLIKHFKLHGLHLYKCGNCSFLHHLKHKVERHFNETHPNLSLKLVTVRALEAEPTIDDSSPRTPLVQFVQKVQKPWRCCMCKSRSNTIEDIQNHVLVKHEIDSQYKCALCTFKSNDIEKFEGHFKDVHPNNTVDVISAYCKTDEGKKSEILNVFDTTPLWLRDKPRIRHIRGILFDDSTAQPVKITKKVAKIPSTHLTSPSTSSTDVTLPSTSTEQNSKNLDLSIDAVAKGTADILKFETEQKDIFEMIQKELKGTKVDYLSLMKDDNVIVIDDDEPEIIEVDDLFTTHFDYEDESMSVKQLMERYGSLGTPSETAFKCPLCNSFQSEHIIQFIHHVFKDLNYRRFCCKICSETAITSNSIITHLYNKHPNENQNLSPQYNLNINNYIEIWLRMVVYHQSKLILKNYPKIDNKQSGGALECKICKKRFLQYTDLTKHKHVHWSRKPFACAKCDYESFWIKNLQSHYIAAHPRFNKIEVKKKSLTVTDLLNETVRKSIKLFNKLKGTDILSKITTKKVKTPALVKEKPSTMGNELETPTVSTQLETPSVSTKLDASVETESQPVASDKEADEPSLDVISVDDAESSPTVLLKSEIVESQVDENIFYFCLMCAYIAKSKQEVKDHCTTLHCTQNVRFKMAYKNCLETYGCNYCNFIGNELLLRAHHLVQHVNRVFKPLKYVCGLCSKRSIRISNLKSHFKYLHQNDAFSYKVISDSQESLPVIQPEATTTPSKTIKEKLYSCSLCKFTAVSNKSAKIKWHFQSHFLAYTCGNCGKTFRAIGLAKKHHQADHGNETENVIVDQKMVNDCSAGLRKIVATAKFHTTAAADDDADLSAEKAKTKFTARKSTGKPTNAASEQIKEYSFYGQKSDETDLKQIITTVDVNKDVRDEQDVDLDTSNMGFLSPTDFSDVEDTFALENIVPSLDSLFNSVPEPFNF